MKRPLHTFVKRPIYALAILASMIAIVMIIRLVKKRFEFFQQEQAFIEKEIHGVIIKISDSQRGEYSLQIKESATGSLVQYSLSISDFLKENNIQINDSLSKGPNSHDVLFYKHQNGSYGDPISLYYY